MSQQDANLRAGRPARLGGKFEQNQRFPIKIIHVCARLFTGFLPDNWWHGRPPQTANSPRPDGSAFRPSSRYRVRSGWQGQTISVANDTNRTNGAGLLMSVVRGRPEVTGRGSNRRD